MQASVDVSKRRLIEGPNNGLMMITPLKHRWARDIWKTQLANTWFAAEIDLSRDVKEYPLLSEAERGMYDKALAFLSNLDGIQFTNLMGNIGPRITSPEVSMCVSRQAWEEANHVDAYATMIEAISLNPLDVYTLFERDDMLKAKNAHIMMQSEILSGDFSAGNFGLALVANMALEGIYFYSGFLAFYILARMGKMLGSTDMIRLIQRDEETHLRLFQEMFRTLRAERGEVFSTTFEKMARKVIERAVELEAAWGKYIIAGGILGLTEQHIDGYIRHLADERLKGMGYEPMYRVKNPLSWVEKFARVNRVETNFFEGKITDYKVGGGLKW